MLITTPATVIEDYALIEDYAVVALTAAPAAQRPLAGFGAGAFACGSANAVSSIAEAAGAPALPRIRRPLGVGGLGHGVQRGDASSRIGQDSPASTKPNQMTRVYPAAPGVVGPYPAREPGPV